MTCRISTMLIVMLLFLPALVVISTPARANADSTLVADFDVSSDGTRILASYLGSPVTLEYGALYLVVARASGEWWYDTSTRPQYLAADAQYYTTDPSNAWNWKNHFPAPNGHSFLQISDRDVNWGPFSNGNTGHSYAVYYFGKGEQVSFRIVDWMDGNYRNNGCHIPVSIFRLPQCFGSPHTIGFWKNHPDQWPVDSITLGGATYTKDQALEILRNANAKDATVMLAAQLIATKLNILSGACPGSSTIFDTYTISDADAFLSVHAPGSNPRGADRDQALMLKDALDNFNNGY